MYLCKPRATWRVLGLFLLLEWWCDSLSLKSVAGTLFVVLFVVCCCVGHREDQFSEEDEQCVVVASAVGHERHFLCWTLLYPELRDALHNFQWETIRVNHLLPPSFPVTDHEGARHSATMSVEAKCLADPSHPATLDFSHVATERLVQFCFCKKLSENEKCGNWPE